MEQTNFVISVLSDTTCAIKKYNGSDLSIEIPSLIENDGKKYQVVEIAPSTFKSKKIKSVSLPEGLKVINDDAFNGCDQLEKIQFPSTLTVIKDNAFKGCFKLNGIVLPQSLTTIGEHCFEYCKALTAITLPASLKVVPKKAFLNCESLEQLTISDGVEEIKENAFYYCNFVELVIPDSVKEIERKAFSSCLRLTNVTLSEELKSSLDEGAFSGCKSVVFNTGAKPAPVGDTKKEKTKPGAEKTKDSVQKDSSDKHCNVTNEDWMKSFVIEILDPKQKSCIIKKYKGKTDTVVVPQEVEIDGSLYTVTAIGDEVFSESNKTCRIKEVQLPETITSIGDRAFEECRVMEKINIPSGVTHFGEEVFSSCYPNVGCVLYDKGTKLYTYLTSGIFEDVEVPEGVVEIDAKAFYYKEMGSVTLPSTLKKIGESAFENGGCTQINLPEGLEEIGKSAFSHCKMKKITIPAGVKVIREDTFSGCGSLERVVFPAGLKEIEESAFAFCSRLAAVKLPKGVKVHKFAFENKTAISYVSEDEVSTKVEKNATIDTEDLYVILSPNNLPNGIGVPYVEEEFDEGKNIFLFHAYEDARVYMVDHDFEDYDACYLIGHFDPTDKCNLRSIFKNLLKMGVTHYLLDGKSLGSIEAFFKGIGGSEGVADLSVSDNMSESVSSMSQLLSMMAGENPTEEDKNAIQEFQNMFNEMPSVHVPIMNFTYPFTISKERVEELLEQVKKSKSLDDLYDKMMGNTYYENCFMSFCFANGGIPEEVEERYKMSELVSVCASAIWYTLVTNQARLFVLENASTGDMVVQPLSGTNQVMVVVAYTNLLRYMHPNLNFAEVEMADLSSIMEEHDEVAGILFTDMQGISAFAGRPGWLSK